jgi:hypothetical protein
MKLVGTLYELLAWLLRVQLSSGQYRGKQFGRLPVIGNKSFPGRSYQSSHLTNNFQRLPDAYTATNDSSSDKGLVKHDAVAIHMGDLQPGQIAVTNTCEMTTAPRDQGRGGETCISERTRI